MKIYFSENIKRLRKEKGLTQQGLADLLGVSCQAISKWERGDSLPDITLLPEIASCLGTSIDFLLSVNNEEREKKISEYLELFDNEHYKNTPTLFCKYQHAVQEFPSDFRILVRYMELLMEEKDDVMYPDYEKTSQEIVSIYYKIQNSCTDDSIRMWSKHLFCDHLCRKADCLNDKESKNAVNLIINTMPALKDSKEMLAVDIAQRGDVNTWYKNHENVIEELLYLLQKVIIGYCYYDKSFEPTYKINVIEHMLGLFSMIDSNERYSKNRVSIIYNYGHLGHLYYEIGDTENALKNLRICAELAKDFDEHPELSEKIFRFYEKEKRFREMDMCTRMTTLMTKYYHLPDEFTATDEFKNILDIMKIS